MRGDFVLFMHTPKKYHKNTVTCKVSMIWLAGPSMANVQCICTCALGVSLPAHTTAHTIHVHVGQLTATK